VREYVLTGVLVAAVTFVLTPYVRRIAILTHSFTEVRERDVHTVPTPRLGGVGMFIGLCAGLLVASRLPTTSKVSCSVAACSCCSARSTTGGVSTP